MNHRDTETQRRAQRESSLGRGLNRGRGLFCFPPLLLWLFFSASLCLCRSFFASLAQNPSAPDEFRVKPQGPFEFAEKPTVTRQGDRVTIAFAVKAACDVTIVIEDAGGKILRHLASGVLGDKAPPPLQKASLKQTIV